MSLIDFKLFLKLICEHSLFLMTDGEYQISLGICLQRVQDPKDVRITPIDGWVGLSQPLGMEVLYHLRSFEAIIFAGIFQWMKLSWTTHMYPLLEMI